MRNEEINGENDVGNGMSQRAISIYGQNEGMDDFPVLKAFQQYIDAEQEKARRRMVSLSIVFGTVLLLIVIGAIAALLAVVSRNQRLNDQLIAYAMSERSQRNDTVPSAAQPRDDTALKAISETLSAMQRKLEQPETASAQTSTDLRHEQNIRKDAEKLEREKMLLEAEKRRVAEEKERLRQIEIDRQRRKLYPELYGDEDTDRRPYQKSNSRTRTLTDDDIRDIIREAYSESAKEEARAETERQKKTEKTPDGEIDKADEQTTDAIEYFKDDEYTIPVDAKSGASSKIHFTVPVN